MIELSWVTYPNDAYWKELEAKDVKTIRLCLDDNVMYHIMNEESSMIILAKLENQYLSKSLMNKLYLKQKLFDLKMLEGMDIDQHINVFNQIISDLKRTDMNFDDEYKMLMLFNSLPALSMNEILVTTLI